jgi:hypothetical protein
MNINSSLSFFGDSSYWSEDVKWLIECQAWKVLSPFSQRIRWVHLYLEPHLENSDHVLARIQIDLAGHQLYSVVTHGSCPQSAMCMAFTLLLQEIEKNELIAV